MKARLKVARSGPDLLAHYGSPKVLLQGPLGSPASGYHTIMTEAEEDSQPVSFLADHYHVQGYNIQHNKRRKKVK